MDELSDQDRAVLQELGDDWRFFSQIVVPSLPRRWLKGRLASLRARGYVESRRNDIYGLTEYALTEKAWDDLR